MIRFEFRRRALAAATCVAVLLGAYATAHACLWDEDTLAMETRAFPSALELITGRFPRHGEAFYRWRIADRQERVDAGTATLEDLDDIAVALDKIGEPEKAIEVMQTSLAREPDRYRTIANLGTFHIHAGQLEQGREHILRAIKINPDAHFGREKYQAALVQYVLSKRKDGRLPLPMQPKPAGHGGLSGFAALAIPEDGGLEDVELRTKDVRAAVKGVLGMMRFGNHASPVLLEALGDLLLVGEAERDYEGAARQLAARAYLRASTQVKGEAREAYRIKAEDAVSMQRSSNPDVMRMRLEEIEEALATEVKQAEALHAKVLADEARWIANGDDPSARFAETYLGKPPAAPAGETPPAEPSAGPMYVFMWLAGGLLLLAIVVLSTTRRRRR